MRCPFWKRSGRSAHRGLLKPYLKCYAIIFGAARDISWRCYRSHREREEPPPGSQPRPESEAPLGFPLEFVKEWKRVPDVMDTLVTARAAGAPGFG